MACSEPTVTASHFSLRSFHNLERQSRLIYGTAVNEQGLTSYQSMARLTRPGDRVLTLDVVMGRPLKRSSTADIVPNHLWVQTFHAVNSHAPGASRLF